MAEKIAVENGQISNFEGLVTLTMNRVILHTIVHHSPTSIDMSNITEIEETFCGWTDVCRYVCTYACMEGQTNIHLRPALLGGLCQRVNLKIHILQDKCALFSVTESKGFISDLCSC